VSRQLRKGLLLLSHGQRTSSSGIVAEALYATLRECQGKGGPSPYIPLVKGGEERRRETVSKGRPGRLG